MKFVKQRQDDDCGYACIAMVSNKTYKEVKSVCFKSSWGMDTETLIQNLNKLEVSTAERFIPFRKYKWNSLRSDAILRCKFWDEDFEKFVWHYVVWDSKRKRVLDPNKEDISNYIITSYLKIEEK